MSTTIEVTENQQFFLTFGTRYTHEEHPTLGKVDPYSYVVIEAPNELQARRLAHFYCDKYWAFLYPIEDLERQVAEGFFPHGEAERWTYRG